MSPPLFFPFHCPRLRFPSPQSTENCCVSFADGPAPGSALCAVCAHLSVLCVWTFDLGARVALWKLRGTGACLQAPRPPLPGAGPAWGAAGRLRLPPHRVLPAGLAAAAGLWVDGGPRAALNSDSRPLPVRASGRLQFWTWPRAPSPVRRFQRWSPSTRYPLLVQQLPARPCLCPPGPRSVLVGWVWRWQVPRGLVLSFGVRRHVHVCVKVS